MTESAPTPPPVQHAVAAAGWYPDQFGAVRYWDGQRWTEHTAPPPSPYQQPSAQSYAAQPTYMVTKTRKQTSHTFHLLMTIFTAGFWGVFVWLPITIYNSMRHDKAKTKIRY
jgi:hypothetical protein